MPVIIIAIALLIAACGTDPTQQIADEIGSPDIVEEDRGDWADGYDSHPNYPASPSDQAFARSEFQRMPAEGKEQVCDWFWSNDDDALYRELQREFDLDDSQANALLNTLWEEC